MRIGDISDTDAGRTIGTFTDTDIGDKDTNGIIVITSGCKFEAAVIKDDDSTERGRSVGNVDEIETSTIDIDSSNGSNGVGIKIVGFRSETGIVLDVDNIDGIVSNKEDDNMERGRSVDVETIDDRSVVNTDDSIGSSVGINTGVIRVGDVSDTDAGKIIGTFTDTDIGDKDTIGVIVITSGCKFEADVIKDDDSTERGRSVGNVDESESVTSTIDVDSSNGSNGVGIKIVGLRSDVDIVTDVEINGVSIVGVSISVEMDNSDKLNKDVISTDTDVSDTIGVSEKDIFCIVDRSGIGIDGSMVKVFGIVTVETEDSIISGGNIYETLETVCSIDGNSNTRDVLGIASVSVLF